MKANLRTKITQTLAQTHHNNPYGNLLGAAGSQLAVQMIDPLLDATITPEAITELLQGRSKVTPGSGGSGSNARVPWSFIPVNEDIVVTKSYESFDAFAVTLKDKKSDKYLAAFILKRQGLFTWKVSEVHLPD
jgi:hypothetical protein